MVKYYKAIDPKTGLMEVGVIVRSQITETELEGPRGKVVVPSPAVQPATYKEYVQCEAEFKAPVYKLCAQG